MYAVLPCCALVVTAQLILLSLSAKGVSGKVDACANCSSCEILLYLFLILPFSYPIKLTQEKNKNKPKKTNVEGPQFIGKPGF